MIKLLLVGIMFPFIQLIFIEYLLLPDPGIKHIAVNRQKYFISTSRGRDRSYLPCIIVRKTDKKQINTSHNVKACQ